MSIYQLSHRILDLILNAYPTVYHCVACYYYFMWEIADGLMLLYLIPKVAFCLCFLGRLEMIRKPKSAYACCYI